MAFAHYGLSTGMYDWCVSAREQLVLWVDTVRQLASEGEDDLESRLFERLMETDPLYGQGRFDELPKDIQRRERTFLGNTMEGMLGYVKSQI